jgi:hypothetical protein
MVFLTGPVTLWDCGLAATPQHPARLPWIIAVLHYVASMG